MTDERTLTTAELDTIQKQIDNADLFYPDDVQPLLKMARRVAALEAENARLRELAKWPTTEYVKDNDALTYHEWRRLYYGDWVIGEDGNE